MNRSWESGTDPTELRASEKEVVSPDESGDFVSIFDLRPNTKLNAALGIGRTFFVCLVLAAGALFFSKDANDLVIAPIENMIQKVNRISKNPLEAA